MNKDEAKIILQNAHENFLNKKFSLARDLWLKCLEINPNNISLLKSIALTYFNEQNLQDTEKFLKKILNLNFSEPKVLTMLILVLEDQDKISDAKEFIQLGLKKNVLDHHWRVKMDTMMPIIKFNNLEVESTRLDVEKKIDETLSDPSEYQFNLDTQMIRPLQFGLSYDQFDNLELNKKCIKFYKKIYPELNRIHSIKKVSSSKIKIGFISEYLTDHTIGKLFKGIILKLNKKNFEVLIFHSEKTKKGKILDELKQSEQDGNLKNFFLPKSFTEIQKIILDQNLDILFYPEIGLSLQLYYLSFLRLAKVQITSWGHPETTGNPSIDYFLTSNLIEAEGSQKNFSEKLIHLDYMPMYYYTPQISNKITKDQLSKKNIYSCPQTLQKLHPEFDLIIGGILESDKNAFIYFIKDTNKTFYLRLIQRFKRNKKIDLNRIKFLDGLNWEQYINLCGESSVLLDPIYYGAGNSFYESVYYGTPSVTMPTQYTKTRLVLGAYNQIDISDLDFNPFAKSLDEYILRAVEIGNDKNLYDLKKNIEIRAKKNLYENEAVIPNFEKAFEKIMS